MLARIPARFMLVAAAASVWPVTSGTLAVVGCGGAVVVGAVVVGAVVVAAVVVVGAVVVAAFVVVAAVEVVVEVAADATESVTVEPLATLVAGLRLPARRRFRPACSELTDFFAALSPAASSVAWASENVFAGQVGHGHLRRRRRGLNGRDGRRALVVVAMRQVPGDQDPQRDERERPEGEQHPGADAPVGRRADGLGRRSADHRLAR